MARSHIKRFLRQTWFFHWNHLLYSYG
jgi:hypothetical protein